MQTVASVPLVELQPDHPENDELFVGEAVSVSVLPMVNCSLQDPGLEQLIEPVTVPVPRPAKLTVRIGSGPAGVQPRLAGPSTVIVEGLLTTKLGLS